MDELNFFLNQSLQKGFIDQTIHSKKEYLPQLITNDKLAGKKVLTTIDRELKTCDEFWFSVAFVTTSGVATLINTFRELEKKGVKGKILVSQYLNFTQPEALKRLLQFKNIELKIIVEGDFHSKGYLFKKGGLYNLIIGSSNLTASALCSNKEWNLKISATPISDIIFNAIKEFSFEFENATLVTLEYISKYEEDYNNKNFVPLIREWNGKREIVPNSMQVKALNNLEELRFQGKSKALLISATGTGKTYLSAFDAKKYNPKKFLFVVHRANIAEAAMKTFKLVFGSSKTMGMYSGNRRELEADFIFSTIQTISRAEHLSQFDSEMFDYIVVDETHRAGANSYQKILDYFRPKFLLGMTATPERTDGLDIFKLFDYNIAYEIRLHNALDQKMLSPFHYYGVTDITVDGITLEETSDFNLLTADERVDRIIEKVNFYGSDSGIVRGLIFCSKIDECKYLSQCFNTRGFSTVALTGENNEIERTAAINRLESDNPSEKLDYIFTVDIFNEGIDIPRVNQVIMLRPTQSAIVFVQQLGRGLRKIDNKEYLTVIDFIGNYNNNYLVPVALYGDTSYNKDTLRKLIASGSSLIPGTSTINFDKITRDRIFESIDSANMQKKKDLVKDYQLLKFKLGHIPMMVDFLEHGSRDSQLYVDYSKSYFNFVSAMELELKDKLNSNETKLLELFSCEINNMKRVEESIILKMIIDCQKISIREFKELVQLKYGYLVTDVSLESCINSLNFGFVTENHKGKLLKVGEIYGIEIIKKSGDEISIGETLSKSLLNPTFKTFLIDNTINAIKIYDSIFAKEKFYDGFILYQKYSRKDAFRILNWDSNPLAQNVGGYMVSTDKLNCPIFVNYHKAEGISDTTKYEDGFINNSEIEYMSKSKRTLTSPDVQTIRNYKNGLRLPLFIKKNNDEGTEFYYMGDITPIKELFEQKTMPNGQGNNVSVVKMTFSINHIVEDSIYEYITQDHTNSVNN